MLSHRTRVFGLAIIGFLILVVGTQVIFADQYYWRWTSATGYECGADGDDYLFLDAQNYEYSLPASGAVISQFEIDNGSSSYIGDITGLSGSGSGTETISASYHGPDPFTYAFQRDTMVDGKLVYRSTLTYTCTDLGEGADVNVTITNQAFGEGSCPPIPDGSVVGDMPLGAQAFYAPGKATNISINPGTYWVIGQDESGEYYKILLSCQYLWVPVDTMQPNYDDVWNGTPLPTQVVS